MYLHVWQRGRRETARDQWSVRGYRRGFDHVDIIPAEVWGKSCVPPDRRTRC